MSYVIRWSVVLLASGLALLPSVRPGSGQAPPELTAAGVSLALAQHRAQTLSEVSYDLVFRIPEPRDSAVTGEATVRFRREDDGPVILDFADPGGIQSVTVGGEPVDWAAVTTHLVIPAEALPPGRGQVTIRFVAGDGPLNRRDDFLYTLFVPDRAHEAFPAFDQPDLKARFRLALDVPGGWRAAANEAPLTVDSLGGRVIYRFRETEPLPTYLFAFAAGAFDVVERTGPDGRAMRFFHRETDRDKVARNLDEIFRLHRAALAWLEDYTGIEYPFRTFDFLAIPAFQYGGMEHPGAILYRADRLFLDETATRNQELGRASLIAHETAHMWFGDLVTMEWFSDVWMKEVFANFMAARIVHPSFPDIDHELRFLLAHYPSAYGVDRTRGANPIRQPLENLADAGSLYGAIIYQKAPIVMRQLERLTGEAAFRHAVRRYLEDHRFGNAGWPVLVAELDRVTELDVAAWSRVWVEEAGRPWVRVVPGAGRAALIPVDPSGVGRVWPQQLAVRIWDGDTLSEPRTVTLADGPATVPLDTSAGPRAILPAAAGLGYGLFLLDGESTATLLRDLPRIPDALARASGWLTLWENMLVGRVDPAALFDTGLALLRAEANELVAQQVLGDLPELAWRYLPDAERERRVADVADLLWQRMQAAEDRSLKAAFYDGWRRFATSTQDVTRLRRLWAGDLAIEGLPLSESDRTTLALDLAVRGVTDWRAILDAQEARIENPDRRDRFRFIRSAAAADPEERERFFARLTEPEGRAREAWVADGLALLHHPLRAAESLRYIRPGLELLEEVQRTGDIFFPTNWLAATLGGHRSPEAAAIVLRFMEDNPDLPPRLLEKLLQQADGLFRAADMRGGS